VSDVFDVVKRSEVMSRIRGKGNKTTEIALAAALRKAGITGWRRHILLKVKAKPSRRSHALKLEIIVVRPDFIFRQAKLAVFVDGCFWHQCPLHSKVPENNREFWEQKLRRNVERDRETNRALRAAGWRVLRLWEHELQEPSGAIRKVKRQLRHSW
jgi:DNA mismatch endonuclease (patch repair protein)